MPKKGGNLKIYARLRVIMPWENDKISATQNENKIHNRTDRRETAYEFSKVFGPTVDNFQLFENTCVPILDKVLEGFNGLLIAYGQTGSGKTYSVLGKASRNIPGVLLLSLQHILKQPNVKKVELSAVESFGHNLNKIQLFDLCDLRNQCEEWKSKLGATQTDAKNGLVRVELESEEHAAEVIRTIHQASHFAPTGKNPESSRGHVAFIARVSMAVDDEEDTEAVRESHYIVVDLAGSEGDTALTPEFTAQCSEFEVTQRRLEAGCINHGLSQLQLIFNELRTKKKLSSMVGIGLRRTLHSFINVRSVISVLFTISPSRDNAKSTESTLRFAEQAALVKTTPVKARASLNKDELIKKLKAIIATKDSVIDEQKRRISLMEGQLSQMIEEADLENDEEDDDDPSATEKKESDVIASLRAELQAFEDDAWENQVGMRAQPEDVEDIENELEKEMSATRRASRVIDSRSLRELRKSVAQVPSFEAVDEKSDEESDLSDLSEMEDDQPFDDAKSDSDLHLILEQTSVEEIDFRSLSPKNLQKYVEVCQQQLKEKDRELKNTKITIEMQEDKIVELQQENRRLSVLSPKSPNNKSDEKTPLISDQGPGVVYPNTNGADDQQLSLITNPSNGNTKTARSDSSCCIIA